MAKITIAVDSTAEPKQVLDALLDFSERRPDVWPGLSRDLYEVYSVGETSAEIKEGSSKPSRVWARERYDWSTPGVVRWTVEESNFCVPGSYVEARVRPGDGGGGSHVDLEWNRRGSNPKGRMIVVFMKLAGPAILKSYLTKTLNGLAEHSTS